MTNVEFYLFYNIRWYFLEKCVMSITYAHTHITDDNLYFPFRLLKCEIKKNNCKMSHKHTRG